MVNRGLFKVIEIDGVVDVTEWIEFVESHPEMRQIDMASTRLLPWGGACAYVRLGVLARVSTPVWVKIRRKMAIVDA
jgi:hypothetical protein